MISIAKNIGHMGDRYAELIQELPLRPLRNMGDYRRAVEVLNRLASHNEGSLSVDEQDYMDTLALLVEEYDRQNVPIDTSCVAPIDVLKHLMEENDMNTSDLGRLLGSKGVASEVLNGKRSLSKAHITKLAQRFNVDVSLFFPLPRKR